MGEGMERDGEGGSKEEGVGGGWGEVPEQEELREGRAEAAAGSAPQRHGAVPRVGAGIARGGVAGPRDGCPVCGEGWFNLQGHAEAHHLPGVMDVDLDPLDPAVRLLRKNAIWQLARWVLFPLKTDHWARPLMEWVRLQDQGDLMGRRHDEPAQLVWHQAMQALCEDLGGGKPPGVFRVRPLNSPGALLHWSSQLTLLSAVTPNQWRFWMDTYPAPEGARRLAGELQSFDAHFHFDRLCRHLNTRCWEQLEERGREQSSSLRRDQQGGCTSFCDVATWPSAKDLDDMPPPFTAVVGMHPKYFKGERREVGAEELRRLGSLLEHRRVSGLGEVGLDYSVEERWWYGQAQALREMLPLSQCRQVIVLHCRPRTSSIPDILGPYLHLWTILSEVLRRREYGNRRKLQQPLVLHSFSGDRTVVDQFVGLFDHCYFSFSGMVSRFETHQTEALRAVPEDRLLLETDAPHLPVGGRQFSSPWQLRRVAREVAVRLEMRVDRVMALAVMNGRRVFRV